MQSYIKFMCPYWGYYNENALTIQYINYMYL